MADNNQLLNQIGNLIDEKLEPVKKDLQGVKHDVQGIKQEQAEQKTLLEAIEAGQKDQATKADIHRLEQKIDKVYKHSKKQEQSIANIEEQTGIASPHKN